tara:strand:+ start:18496 stop:18747 length:252 start_codon:yes stop_codon:yes gene_type:complete
MTNNNNNINEIDFSLKRLNNELKNEIEFIVIKDDFRFYLKTCYSGSDCLDDFISSSNENEMIKIIDSIYKGLYLANRDNLIKH